MEIILIFTGSFVIALSGALMPGPLLTVTIVQSIKKGFKAGPFIILGHMVLELSLLVGLLFGLQKFLLLKTVMQVIFIMGGAILIAMGVDLVRHAKKTYIRKVETHISRKELHPVLAGILVSLSNPYWIVWWITIGLGYMIKAIKLKFWGIASFFIGHILADFAWYSFIALAFSRGKKFISNKMYQIIILVCGILLILFGFWFLYSGVK